MSFDIPTRILPHAEGLPLPTYQTPSSAGMDLYAVITDDITLQPLEKMLGSNGIDDGHSSGV